MSEAINSSSLSKLVIQPWQISGMSLSELITAGRKVQKGQCRRELRVAILGDCATQHYTHCLSAALKLRGFWPQIYEAEFDMIDMELRTDTSGINIFKPEVVVFFNCVQKIESRFKKEADDKFSDKILVELSSCWEMLLKKHNAVIVQHNLCVPLDFTYGNFSRGHTGSLGHTIMEVNRGLFPLANKFGNVHIVDTDFQASLHGKLQWIDEGLWCQAKQALSPRFLPPLVKVTSDAILESFGVGIKCVVLDLDNTTWGGILGDVGINNIELGELSGMGGIFTRFQEAMKRLKERGILLAVCSKNEQKNVDEVFLSHPEMVLRQSDIVASIANYEDKATNIKAIQEVLNIGLDSFLFLDDSPIERDFVRQMLPDVQVPELPEDPAGVLQALANWNFFDATKVSQEDGVRTGHYQAEAQRKKLLQTSTDYDSYLRDLETVAEVEPFSDFTIVRAHQLLQRSNQYNLTTQRHSEIFLKEIMSDPNHNLAFTVRLRDRVSDHGIISVCIARVIGKKLEIDSWVMSCRVLGRHVEDVVYNTLLNFSRKRGLKTIMGRYIKTPKNSMVIDLLPKFGFQSTGSERDTKSFSLDVDTAKNRENLPMLSVNIEGDIK